MSELSPEERDILLRVVEKPELEGYFFKKIKALKWFDKIMEQGLLEPERIPRPVEKEPDLFNIPHWPVLNYLAESSKRLAESDADGYAEKYLQLIRNYTVYCQTQGFSNYHVWWTMSEVLQHISIELISIDDVDMFAYWLEDRFESGLTSDELVKVLLIWFDGFEEKHAEKCLRLIEALFAIEEVPRNRGINEVQEPVLKAQSYRLTESIKSITDKSGALLGESVARYFIEQLKSVVSIRGGDEYCYVWRPAIEDHEQNMSARDTEDHFILAARESILSAERVSNGSLRTLVLELANSEKNILKRMALYITNEFFETYKDDVFNALLDAESLQANLKHEMWELVKCHYVDFSVDQKTNFKALVGDLKRYKAPDEPDLYHQAEWLLAIKDIDVDASMRYQEIVDELGVEPEHPGFSSYMTSGWVGKEDESPISLETLKSIEDMAEIVDLLNAQPITQPFREPGIEGLAGCVKTYVLTEEEEGKQFFKKLNDLQELKVIFLHEVVDAYSLIWREPDKYGAFSWKEAWPFLIDFFGALVNSVNFWKLDGENEELFIGRQPWLVSNISRVLESGCKNDEDGRLFSLDSVDKVRVIVSTILEKQPSVEFDLESDAVTRAINSPKGQALEALINLALFESRHADRQTDGHDAIWEKYVDVFEAEMLKDNNIELYTLAPLYLNNFEYLSKNWMDSHFEFFFNYQDETKWVCALQGYAHNSYLHPKLYTLLKQEKVFEDVLDRELRSRVDKRYIEFGLIPFLTGKESLGDSESLVERILARNNSGELRQVIWFVRSVAKSEEEKKAKVYELFPKIIDGIDYIDVEGKKLASNLLHWLKFIDELNVQTIEWVSRIAPYAEADFNYNDLVEAFAKWSENYPAEVANIWLQVLEEGSGYPYPEEAFKIVYKNLINADMERNAKDIASGYIKYNAHRPAEWLKEVTEELRDV